MYHVFLHHFEDLWIPNDGDLGALICFPKIDMSICWDYLDDHLRRALQAELDQESTRTRAEAHFFKMQALRPWFCQWNLLQREVIV